MFFLGAVPFLSLMSSLVYRRRKLFFTELTVPYLYLSGQLTTIVVLVVPALVVFGDQAVLPWMLVTLLIVYYLIFKMHKQIFNDSWLRAISKSLFIIWGGQMIYGLVTYLVFNVWKAMM